MKAGNRKAKLKPILYCRFHLAMILQALPQPCYLKPISWRYLRGNFLLSYFMLPDPGVVVLVPKGDRFSGEMSKL